jgi:hypothetical protein
MSGRDKYGYPDTSWMSDGTARRLRRVLCASVLHRRRFWIIFTISLVLLAPTLGALVFLVHWGRGMRSFGAPSGPGGVLELIELLASLPLPIDAIPAWVFNGVCCAILTSYLVASVLAHFTGERTRGHES